MWQQQMRNAKVVTSVPNSKHPLVIFLMNISQTLECLMLLILETQIMGIVNIATLFGNFMFHMLLGMHL